MRESLINLIVALVKIIVDLGWFAVIAGMIWIGVREVRDARREHRSTASSVALPALGSVAPVEHVGATEDSPALTEMFDALDADVDTDHEFAAMMRAAAAEIADIHHTTMAAFDHAMDDYLARFHANTMVAHLTADAWHEDGCDVCEICHPPTAELDAEPELVVRGWREATHTGEYCIVHPTDRDVRELVEALLCA